MSMEIPTIASRRGILPETVVEGETGCLVDESAEALAEALLDVGQNPEAWAVRGKAARRRVLARHATGAQADRLERFYREVIGES
jgi:glycosyltransferase involved in cell wall biosynthesis